MHDALLVHSMLDDDLYKFTTGAVVFQYFRHAKVCYKFFNRGKTVFPRGFARALRRQINLLQHLRLTAEERLWLSEKLPMLPHAYLEFLSDLQMDPREVDVTQTGGELEIVIEGYWYRTIYWEVKLMSIISELYFIMTGQKPDEDWDSRILKKGLYLQAQGCEWLDFGTRRRFSFETQDAVVDILRPFTGFLGTSNPFLAMKYNVPVKGTYPHEAIMAMSALYGVIDAHTAWHFHWEKLFWTQTSLILTDTFTTKFFLFNCRPQEAKEWKGLRQDSGDPQNWADNLVLPYYRKHRIDTRDKIFLFSDGLTDVKYVLIHERYRKVCRPQAGIGTYLTNDVGAQPLNMVIKMTDANFTGDWKPVVKISDTDGKHTGNPAAVEKVLQKLASYTKFSENDSSPPKSGEPA